MAKKTSWRFTEKRKNNIKRARTTLREIIHLGKMEYDKRHKSKR